MARDLLFEIGCEDLPPLQIAGALRDLEAAFTERASEARIEHGDVRTWATPRRMTLFVADVAESQRDLEETRVGPPVMAAYRDGEPTKAALGFCRGQGVELDDLIRVTQEKKKGKPAEYIAAVIREPGKPTNTLLPAILEALPRAIAWPKSMRWARCPQPFARPVHWLVALFGSDVLDVSFAGVTSGRTSYGHRFHYPDAFELGSPDEYLDTLRARRVLADIDERRSRVAELAAEAVQSTGGRILEDDELLDEIVQLVEWPVPIVGTFDEAYLELPNEVLVTSMKKHQRYFAVVDERGASMPHFVTISNTEVRDPAVVAQGNHRVLRARLEDARFFFREDQKKTLDEWAATLDRVTYVRGLGSVGDKVTRLVSVATWLAETVAPNDADLKQHVARAASLCKADLSTGMVDEFSDLQGLIGGEYARNAGEPDAVADAIREHYLPRGASDDLPSTLAGALVSIADRIDSIAALFGLGRIPTGAADPFALRRAALGIIRIARERDLRVSLRALIDRACSAVETTADALGTDLKLHGAEHREAILDFVLTRVRNVARDKVDTNIVDAVLALGAELEDLPATFARIDALAAIRDTEEFEPIGVAFKRVGNILGDPLPGDDQQVDPERFEEEAERALFGVMQGTREMLDRQFAERDFAGALGTLITLRPPVDVFFDGVMVNAEDDALRRNRHALLRDVLVLFLRFADVRKL